MKVIYHINLFAQAHFIRNLLHILITCISCTGNSEHFLFGAPSRTFGNAKIGSCFGSLPYLPSVPSVVRGMTEKSTVAEHACENHHPIHWEETTIPDHGRGQEQLVKEALHKAGREEQSSVTFDL